MKYCVLIIDGAADRPLPQHGNKTCLEMAYTPSLDTMAGEGVVGLVRTVPRGMEPSSSCACMSILGYDPERYPIGRSAIEARSMGLPFDDGDALFRCNLVAVEDGRMLDYSSGHISTAEARSLIDALQDSLGGDRVHFYPGVGYRSICSIKGAGETLLATCTPPHDIPGRPVAEFLPRGPGSELLRDLMARSQEVLRTHPVNREREARGETPATMVWLFWGSGATADLPPFKRLHGLDAAMTSGVDLLRGLAKMADIDNLAIAGVTDGLDNDYAAQGSGAAKALDDYDLVVVHVEAPDEAGHAGCVEEKVAAIERTDREIAGRILARGDGALRMLAMPDHPTPIEIRTHTAEPVPFLMWGPGFSPSGSARLTEAEAGSTGIFIEDGYTIMARLRQGHWRRT